MPVKVMWFVNVPAPAMCTRMGWDSRGSGGWIGSLLQSVEKCVGIEFCVCCACAAESDVTFTEGGVIYRILAQPRYFSDIREKELLKKCADAIKEWHPELIHIHGTERFYGRLAGLPSVLAKIPVVVSLQGVLTACARRENFFGDASLAALAAIFSPKELLTGRGLFWGWRRLCAQAQRERLFCRSISVFFGRTDWDRAWARVLNPAAKYYRVGEVLRPPFYQLEWSVERCRRYQVVFTNAGHPRRGTECLIDALQLLRRDFPEVRLVLAGNLSQKKSYNRYLLKRIRQSGVPTELKGLCSGEEIAQLLVESHVFVLASLIENSANSLCEAQTVGTPAVAADVGGILSLIEHGKSGLLFPKNDAPLLADRIRQIFSDDALARELSSQQRHLATARNGAATVRKELFAAYRAMTGNAEICELGGARE